MKKLKKVICIENFVKNSFKNFVFKKKLGSGVGGNVYQIVHYFSKKHTLKIGGKISDQLFRNSF